MKTAKAKQSRCGVKDDNIGSNLGDSKHHTVALLTMAAVETNTPSNDSQHSNAGLTATAHSLQSPILWQQLRLSSDDDGNSSLLTG